MLDNDELTYSYQKRPKIAGNSRQAERALITVDRSQKLDLLVHLLTNLQQSLIVCGPDGIGKTTLLQIFADNHKDIWPICMLPGSGAVSFESVVAELSRSLNLSNASVNFDLSSLRAFCNKQKVVLIIDDAGELMPGLIGELIDFADSLAGLRLVLAMNNDELQEKTASDSAIEECHFIELPPLNQQQCREYLQNLSAQPGSPLSFSAITDTLVEDMYLQTQGVPGKLVAELPKFKEYQNRHGRQIGLWIGVIMVLAAAGYAVKVFMPADILGGGAIPETALQQEPAQLPNEPVVSVPAPAIEPTVQVRDSIAPASELLPESLLGEDLPVQTELPDASAEQLVAESAAREEKPAENIPVPPVESVEADEPAGMDAGEPAVPAVTEARQPEIKPEDNKPVETQAAAAEAKPVEKPVPAVQKPVPPKTANTEFEGGDIDWIMAQPANNYTVQVMVLSSKASVTRFLRKYADYRDGLKYYAIGREGQEKYVIIYGSFPTSAEALSSKSYLPGEFNNGMVQRFKQVQRASRRK